MIGSQRSLHGKKGTLQQGFSITNRFHGVPLADSVDNDWYVPMLRFCAISMMK
jgi:hypothetical protein